MNRQKLRLYSNLLFAPTLLVVIASVQIYRAQVYGQSPWKGGGFGMFSSVDSPGSRFLRCYLLTEHGQIPVYLPRRYSAALRRIRTAPRVEHLEELAQQLAIASWVPFDHHRRVLGLVEDDPDTRSGGGLGLQSPALDEEVLPVGPPVDLTEADTSGDRYLSPWYRLKGRHEPAPEHPLDLDGVRVELWRFDFDPGPLEVRAVLWQAVTFQKPDPKAEP